MNKTQYEVMINISWQMILAQHESYFELSGIENNSLRLWLNSTNNVIEMKKCGVN